MGSSLGNLNYYHYETNGFTKVKSEKHKPKKALELIKQTMVQLEDSGENLEWKP